ncbi:MAG: SCP2 domain-containing protein [Thiobacillaceae bacterium]
MKNATDATLPRPPAALPRLLERLPHLPVSLALTTALNLVAWPSIRRLDWQRLRGRRFGVRVRDLGLAAYFSVTESGFAPQVTPVADVRYTADLEDFLRLALRLEDPDTLFFDRRLIIEGDTELGLAAKNLLDAIELAAVLDRLPLPLRIAIDVAQRKLGA